MPESSWQPMLNYWDSEEFKKEAVHNKSNANNGHNLALHIRESILISEHKR